MHATLKTTYETLYSELAAFHAADEQVCADFYAKFCAAEMALTDFEYANGLR